MKDKGLRHYRGRIVVVVVVVSLRMRLEGHVAKRTEDIVEKWGRKNDTKATPTISCITTCTPVCNVCPRSNSPQECRCRHRHRGQTRPQSRPRAARAGQPKCCREVCYLDTD